MTDADETTIDDADGEDAAWAAVDGFRRLTPSLVAAMSCGTLGRTSGTTCDGREADGPESEITGGMDLPAARDGHASIDLTDYLAHRRRSSRIDNARCGRGNEWRRPPARPRRNRRDSGTPGDARLTGGARLICVDRSW